MKLFYENYKKLQKGKKKRDCASRKADVDKNMAKRYSSSRTGLLLDERVP